MMASGPAPKMGTKMGTNWWERVVVQRSACAVDVQVGALTERSPFLQDTSASPEATESVALLCKEELRIGRLLGAGTYSNVYEVTGLALLEEQPEAREGVESLATKEARQALKTSVANSEGGARYAIKHLKPELVKDNKTFEHAACDLIIESKFLAQLSHPNILALRGVAFGGSATYAYTGLYDSFFLVVDKIDQTLSERLRRWRLEKISGIRNAENTVLAKIDIALQVANALIYLHDRRLVFRDLKPHNIGLRGGIVQLFDFGFCRELPRENDNYHGQLEWEVVPAEIVTTRSKEKLNDDLDHDDRLYGMSGKGTLMYMSPEVLGTRRYNRKTDVYGWATIFYEMLTLSKPYVIQSVEDHRQAIFRRGERPPLQGSGIPQPIRNLLVNCWDGNIVHRFTMKEAQAHLEFIHSDFAPGMLTAESFHKYVSSTRQLLTPIQDALSTFATDVQAGYENLIKDISGGPRSTAENKDTLRTVLMGTTRHAGDSLSMASSISGLSFAGDDDDECDGDDDEASLADEANQEEEETAEEQEVVLADSDLTLHVVSEEITEDCPDAKEEATSAEDDGSQEDKEYPKPPHAVESTAEGDRKATEVDNFEVSRRRRRQAPRGRNGTLVYHRYYGHVDLNVGKMDEDEEESRDNVCKERSLWSNHCTARAA